MLEKQETWNAILGKMIAGPREARLGCLSVTVIHRFIPACRFDSMPALRQAQDLEPAETALHPASRRRSWHGLQCCNGHCTGGSCTRDNARFTRARVWDRGERPVRSGRPNARIRRRSAAPRRCSTKLQYLHANSVKRGLVQAAEHWRYSSAHEWLPGSAPVLKCHAWRD